MYKIEALFLLVTISLSSVSGTESFVNYATPKTILDFEFRGDTAFIASSGGLIIHHRPDGRRILLLNTTSSPDPYLTALCRDSEKNLWTGSFQGYLVKRNTQGRVECNKSYFASNWRITDILSYKQYLIIGSIRGVSVFNRNKQVAEKNATRFGNLSSSQVNALIVHKDTLYVGLEQGIAKMCIAGDSLQKANFYDPSIWKIDSSIHGSVRSFVVRSRVEAFSQPAALFKGKLVKADSCNFFHNGTLVKTFPSRITALKVNGEKECWIGTEEDFYYLWDGASFTEYTVSGLAFTFVNKIHVDHDGSLWALPRISGGGMQWWRGIASLSGTTWKIFSPSEIPTMGLLGDNPDSRGIIESYTEHQGKKTWKMWFGTSGGQVKSFEPNKNEWSRYCIFAQDYGDGKFIQGTTCPAPDWAKSDALAQDSSGYLWISCWTNLNGSMLCYDPAHKPDPDQTDPVMAHYRRFFPQGNPHYTVSYRSISVDARGDIIAGSEDGKLVVFRHNGNPLKNGITVVNSFSEIGKVEDMVSTSDGLTRIATINGVYSYDSQSGELSKLEDITSSVTSIEAENEYLLWMGMPGTGIVRYDLSNGERLSISTTQGLISDQVTDLAIDRERGYLWVATDRGISRFSVGYKLMKNSTETALVYPNPYYRKKHAGKPIHFKNLPVNSTVLIYSANGGFVARAVPVRGSDNGSYHIWNPSERIVPGTYFYAIRSEYDSKSGKLLITP